MKKAFLFFSLCVWFIPNLFATHNRAGEITYRQLSQTTYEITIVTYTKISSPADRPVLGIWWGDGQTDSLKRVEEVPVGNDIKRNRYVGTHAYPGPATYTIYCEDPNRNAGVLNIPNSVNIPFYIQTILTINPMLGFNNSPILLIPPIDEGCVGKIYKHNPGAYDPDGDSISYTLVPCRGLDGDVIPGYTYPQSSNYLSLNPITGDLIWDSPVKEGEYNIAILIQEWRNGKLIGSILRDMQIDIITCNHYPPVIDPLPDLCVVAGDSIGFPVTASDNDNDQVTLTATGGPFAVTQSPAQFPQPVSGIGTTGSFFSWHTNCSHVRMQPYQAEFKAEDNNAQVHLVDIKTVLITVVGAAPKNLTAIPLGNNVILTWDIESCVQVTGYRIYRRKSFYPGTIQCPCTTGVPASTGFELIATIQGRNNNTFTDSDNGKGLSHGVDYCYMIIATYPDGSESCASSQACAQLKKDLPVITNASVRYTDVTNGAMFVAWARPTELDTVLAPGPYKYLIYHSPGFFGSSFTCVDSLDKLTDTTFVDTMLNTVAMPYSYRIDLYNDAPGNRFLVGSTQTASSVYLTITPTDNRLNLTWEEHVPWVNTTYVIYRKNTFGNFDSIGFSTTQSFSDSLLVNGEEYCYYVKSVGAYSAPGFVNPIINLSQWRCSVPVDNVPPCAPAVEIFPDCDAHKNLLSWQNPNGICADDVLGYHLYHSTTLEGGLEQIALLTSPADTFFLHENLASIAGCYLVLSYDSAGNESVDGQKICVDNCPEYSLPNVFSPGSNGVNDLFVPFPYRYVKNVDITVFNRWGQSVFHTSDPDVKWDGTNQVNKKKCPDGVYYYVCDVHEIHLEGIKTRTITGFVHLLREN